MINNYSLQYDYKGVGDVLIIILNGQKTPTRSVNNQDVVAIYSDDELVGINIFNISKIMKIKSQGMIYLPSNAFIDVINTLLTNASLDTLSYVETSGYVIGEIQDVEEVEDGLICSINLGNEIVHAVSLDKSVKEKDKVVVAIQNTRLPNGEVVGSFDTEFGIINSHLCSYKDLNIKDCDDVLIIDEDVKISSDFFSTEAK